MKVTINLFCEMFYHAFFIYLLQITYIFCPWSHTQTFNLRPKIIKKKNIWILLCWKLLSDQRNKVIVAMCIEWNIVVYRNDNFSLSFFQMLHAWNKRHVMLFV